MQDLATQLPVGALVLNADCKIVSLNPFGCELLGYEPQELAGKRVDTVLTVASRVYFQTHLYPLITLGQVANELYLTLRTRQQAPIPVLLNARWQELADRQVRIYIGFIPLYQRRQYEQELRTAKQTAEQALLRRDELVILQQKLEEHSAELDRQLSILQQRNDELEQFGYIIAHDLQEPLRKITLFASLLQQETPTALTQRGQVALTGLTKVATLFRRLINDLQGYFTRTSHLATIETVELASLIQQIATDYSVAEVQISWADLPEVVGDRQALTNLFRHLLDNAVKFRTPGTRALIRVAGTIVSQNSYRSIPGKYHYINYAQITVSDNGIGFDNRYQEEIFRILKKLDPHSAGIGLGLSLAKKIVERHNGRITAESVVGQGTKITLLLPLT